MSSFRRQIQTASDRQHSAGPYLRADSRRRLAQREDGDVLRSVQPVNGQFGGGGPLHHGHVILTGKHETYSAVSTTVELEYEGKL